MSVYAHKVPNGSDDSDGGVAPVVAAPLTRKRRIVDSDSEDDQRSLVQSGPLQTEEGEEVNLVSPQKDVAPSSFIVPETPCMRRPASAPAPVPARAPSPALPSAPAPASVFILPMTYKAARARAADLIRVVEGVLDVDASSLHALVVSMTHPAVAYHTRGYTEACITKALRALQQFPLHGKAKKSEHPRLGLLGCVRCV